jgi:hypothetical protein
VAVSADDTPVASKPLSGGFQFVTAIVDSSTCDGFDCGVLVNVTLHQFVLEVIKHITAFFIDVGASPLASKLSPWHAWHLVLKSCNTKKIRLLLQ